MLESSSAGETEITPPPKAVATMPENQQPSVDEVDSFPMKCRECGIAKKTVKGLKMHIKLMHLRTGRWVHADRLTNLFGERFSSNFLGVP